MRKRDLLSPVDLDRQLVGALRDRGAAPRSARSARPPRARSRPRPRRGAERSPGRSGCAGGSARSSSRSQPAPQLRRRERRVLAARALPIVVAGDDEPSAPLLARRGNSRSRCWNVNSAIAGTFDRYAITVAPSGERSPVEMSSGATIRTRCSSSSGRGFCSGGGLMFGPRGTSIDAASSSGAGARMCRCTTSGRARRPLRKLDRRELSRVGDPAGQHRSGGDGRGAQVDLVVRRSASAGEVAIERPQGGRARRRRLAHADTRPAGRLEHPQARGEQVDVRAAPRDLVEDLPRAWSRGGGDEPLRDAVTARAPRPRGR